MNINNELLVAIEKAALEKLDKTEALPDGWDRLLDDLKESENAQYDNDWDGLS